MCLRGFKDTCVIKKRVNCRLPDQARCSRRGWASPGLLPGSVFACGPESPPAVTCHPGPRPVHLEVLRWTRRGVRPHGGQWGWRTAPPPPAPVSTRHGHTLPCARISRTCSQLGPRPQSLPRSLPTRSCWGTFRSPSSPASPQAAFCAFCQTQISLHLSPPPPPPPALLPNVTLLGEPACAPAPGMPVRAPAPCPAPRGLGMCQSSPGAVSTHL